MVSLPVHDRGQRQLIEAALRGPYRARDEPQLLGAPRDPGERRAVGRGVHELADVRDRDGAAEGAADDRKAGGAAVGLVELVDVREAAPAQRRLGGCGRGELDRLLCAGGWKRLFDTGFRDRCFRGQDLLGEVERDAREAAVVVLRDPLLEPRTELGLLTQELMEQCNRQPQQAAGIDGLDARRAPLTEEQRPLTEEVALAQVEEIVLPAVLRTVGAQPALLHDVHRAGRLALEHDDLSRLRVDPFEAGEKLAERAGREQSEARVDTQEVPKRALARERLQRLRHLRIGAREPGEDAPAQAQDGYRAARAHGRGPGRFFEQAGLTEAVAAVQCVQRDLFAVLAALDHPR